MIIQCGNFQDCENNINDLLKAKETKVAKKSQTYIVGLKTEDSNANVLGKIKDKSKLKK